MPQMSPMWWFTLFMIFITMYYMFMMMLYFYNTYTPKMKKIKMLIIKQINWKW